MLYFENKSEFCVQVKPLGVIWGKFPQYSAANTIMFDDIRRNFLMNPSNGLRIRAFRQAHVNRSSDKELLKLGKYLKEIASVEDLSLLNHRNWEKYVNKRRRKDKKKRKRSSGNSNDNHPPTDSDNPDFSSLSGSDKSDGNNPSGSLDRSDWFYVIIKRPSLLYDKLINVIDEILL